jgi:phosphoribosyl 1,2-cyclic phosphodiesterase
MKVVSLASGSSGNSILVACGTSVLLIDSGLPTRQMEANLAVLGINPTSITSILITHEHSDHVRSAGVMSRRYRIPLTLNRPTYERASSYLGKVSWNDLPAGSSAQIGEAEVYSFPVSHDAACTVGYYVKYGGHATCITTDIGRVTTSVLEPLNEADLVVLESNHDVDRLKRGPYPAYLKRRILGDSGHLSNASAAEAVVSLNRGKHRWLWLAHLSEVNNSPALAYDCMTSLLRQNRVSDIEVGVAKRDRPSLTWDSETDFCQLGLRL